MLRFPIAFALAAGLGLGTLATTPPVQAQSVTIGPGGVRVAPPPGPARVSAREAQRIAASRGMRRVQATIRSGDEWRVRGFDRRGRHLRVDIDRFSGRVTRVVRRW